MIRQREEMVRTWFDMWMADDVSPLSAIFAEEIVYDEYHGRQFQGLAAVKRWFREWHDCNRVLEWKAESFIHDTDRTVAEWYLEGEDGAGGHHRLDGVYLIEWDEDGRISVLKEFVANFPMVHAYEDET